MIICLDGVDGSGKSTLAAQIKQELEKRYPNDKIISKHAVQIKSDVYTEYYEPFAQYKPGAGYHFILDRWHWGENIYGPLYRGKTAFDTVSFRWIELYLSSIGMRTWHVTQSLETILSRLDSRGEDFLENKHIQYVLDEYTALTKRASGIPQLPTYAKTISPNGPDPELVDFIIKDAVYAEQRAKTFKELSSNYLGRTFIDPRTVLVVENTKNNKNYDPRINKDAAKMLKILPNGFWETFSVVSSNNIDKLDEFLTEYIWSASPLAYGDTVKARLKFKNIPFSEIKPPEVTVNYSYHIRVMSDRVGKVDVYTP